MALRPRGNGGGGKGPVRRSRMGWRAAALGDAAGEGRAEEGDGGHDEDPEVVEEDELVAGREREERARERGAERAREALRRRSGGRMVNHD